MEQPNIRRAKEKLSQAIALHEKHMSGKAPVSGPEGDRSQMAMMNMMKSAMDALNGKQSNGLLAAAMDM